MKLSTAQAWGLLKTGMQATLVNFVYKGKPQAGQGLGSDSVDNGDVEEGRRDLLHRLLSVLGYVHLRFAFRGLGMRNPVRFQD